jgi:predicted O-methyltransferase YrrM
MVVAIVIKGCARCLQPLPASSVVFHIPGQQESKMLGKVKRLINEIVFDRHQIPVVWAKKDSRSWLVQQFEQDFIRPEKSAYSAQIEQLAKATNQLGPQPLWQGYAGRNVGGPTRMSDEVRTAAAMGDAYTWLVQKLQPRIIVEFGTAFGVSGMYFLAGIEYNHKGRLLTFEPNEVWRNLAVANLSGISERFHSVAGTFEDNIEKVLPSDQSIDLAFIDAIHTREFVLPQLEIVLSKCDDKAIIILDDINFSNDMKACWNILSRDERFLAAAVLDQRVGILELDDARKTGRSRSDQFTVV